MSARDNNYVKIHLRLSRHPAVVTGGFAVDMVFGLLLRLAREMSDDGTFPAECLTAAYIRGAYRIDADIPDATIRRGIDGCLGRVTHVTADRDIDGNAPTVRPLVRVDGDRASIIGWEDDYGRQSTAMTATERKRLERERKRAAAISTASDKPEVTPRHAASRDKRDRHACHVIVEENRSDHLPPTPVTGGKDEDEDNSPVGEVGPAPEPTRHERPANVVTFKPAPVAPPAFDGSDAEVQDLVDRWQAGQGHRRESGLIPSPHVVSTLVSLRDEYGYAAVVEAITITLDTAERPSLKYLRKVCESAAGETQRPAQSGGANEDAPRAAANRGAELYTFVADGEWRDGVYMSREAHEARERERQRLANPPTPEENAAVIAQFDALLAVLNAPVEPTAGAM